MAADIRWLRVDEAADRARCGIKTIYRAVRAGQLRAARIGGRRELRLLESWVDGWLLGQAQDSPVEIVTDPPRTASPGAGAKMPIGGNGMGTDLLAFHPSDARRSQTHMKGDRP